MPISIRQIGEYLASGEASSVVAENVTAGLIVVDNLSVVEDQQYQQADVPEAEGMVLNIGPNGLVGLTHVAAPGAVDINTDSRLIGITGTQQEVVAVTTSVEHTPEASSYEFSCRLDNTDNQVRTVTIQLFIDAVGSTEVDVQMSQLEVNHNVLISGPVSSTIPASTVLSFSISANNTGVNVRGDIVASKLKLTKV